MQALREAVDALGHHLDALDLLRGAGLDIEVSPPPERPPGAPGARAASGTGPVAGPDPGAASEPVSAASAPERGPVGEAPAAGSAGHSESSDGAVGPGPSAGGALPSAGERAPRFPPFRDQATGLLSREGFEWVASGELKRCARHGRVFSILLLQPEQADEETLVRSAEVVRRGLRGSDVAGRDGERALLVALPETAPREARAVAERLVEQLEGAGAWSREGRLGMAGYPAHGETVWSLLEIARGKLTQPVGGTLQRGADGGYWSV